MDEQLSVMVVDDHPMWRDAVARDLGDAGLRVVATAATGTEALTRAAATRPRVVVLDLQIPAPSGVEVTARLVTEDPTVRVLILSASGEQADVLEAVKAGATGYLVKSASRRELVEAVHRVASGDTVFTPGLAGLVLGEYRRLADPTAGGSGGEGSTRGTGGGAGSGEAGDTPRLTDRETEVLRLVAKGLSYKQVAEPAGALPPHGAEPRAEHPAQAAAAQPGTAGALRDRAGDRRGLSGGGGAVGASRPILAVCRPTR